jgi:hypothetical protein
MSWLAVALASLVTAVVSRRADWAVAAVLPASLGFALTRLRDGRIAVRFTEDGLDLESPGRSIPYRSVHEVWPLCDLAPNRPLPDTFEIQIQHEAGRLVLPARLSLPSDDVYRFLRGQLPPGGSRAVPPPLQDYLQRQEQTFGADKVWSYAARRGAWFRGRRRLRAAGQAVLWSSLAWIAVAIVTATPAWLIGTLLGLPLGAALLGSSSFGASSPRLRHWRQAGLVISPLGFALQQDDLRGETRWEEILDVTFRRRSQRVTVHSSAQTARGLALKVEGAVILIADVYDRPLLEIHDRILAYWR